MGEVKKLKFILSPFKFIVVLIGVRQKNYYIFKQIANINHFYDWQWKLLDKIYKYEGMI
jgi:hypothetical protein